MTGAPDAVETMLLGIATQAVDNPRLADARLADWIGRTPSLAGETRMQEMARRVPRLIADALLRAGQAKSYSDRHLRDALTDVPAAELAAFRAVVRHLAGEGDLADDLIDAFAVPRGPQGWWDVGAAGMRLLTEELRDQRAG
ncbi:hypothetical protein GCM10027258_92860 [Amycolatopsis stemonae]